MNLKMKTLAAAIIATATASTANANSLLFPYFNTANGAQSIVTIAANPGTDALGAGGSGTSIANGDFKKLNLHYVYNFGANCEHYDGNGVISQGDLMQHSVASPDIAATSKSFGKVVPTDKSTPIYLPFGGATGTDGFLVVSNVVAGTGGPADQVNGLTTSTADLVGSMVVFDPASGMAISYKAISNTSTTEGDFSNIQDTAFTLSWYPQDMVDTHWYGVVASNNMVQTPNYTAGTAWNNNGGVRNNDEVYRSGTSGFGFTCRGVIPRDTHAATLDLAQLIQIPGLNSLGIMANVNLPGVRALGQAADPVMKNGGVARVSFTTPVVLSKLETVRPAVGAPYAGKTLLTIENNLATGMN